MDYLKPVLSFVRQLFLSAGFFSGKSLSKNEIGNVLNKIRPVTSDHELVRVGSAGDGGYLLPKDFDGISAVFSPGVADVAEFESHFIALGIPCFLVDHTVDKPPIVNELIFFERIKLGVQTEPGVSTSLADWVKLKAPEGDLILQIDIEGSEYEALLSAPPEVLNRFRHIIVEFHDFGWIASKFGARIIGATLEKLQKNHVPVHAHPNNCCPPLKTKGLQIPNVVEVTFTRRDRVRADAEFSELPHHLDVPNIRGKDQQIVWLA